jgi:hypothetical protein
MVGNDMILDMGPSLKRRSDYTFKRPPVFRKVDKPEPKVLPKLFQYMLEATPAVSNGPKAPGTYPTPSLTLNASGFDLPRQKRARFNKTVLVTPALIVIILSSLTGLGMHYKGQILAAAHDVKLAIQKPPQPKPNPRQITIRTSDYDSAVTALITQQITINTAGSAQSVSPNTIISWLNITKRGSLTDITVNSSAVVEYLNQVASSSGGIDGAQVNSAANQIGNNILSAKGMTVNL